MSQQAAAGWGMPTAGCSVKASQFFRQRGDPVIKGFNSTISKTANDTFNMGQNQFAPECMQSRKNIANYLQRSTASNKGYLVAETVRLEKQKVIVLPPPIDQAPADVKDQKIIHKEAVQAIAKQRERLNSTLKKGYATVWHQCSQQVHDKLKTSKDWEPVQRK
jgi:hypothetical protein